jgi:hypothetical protein
MLSRNQTIVLILAAAAVLVMLYLLFAAPEPAPEPSTTTEPVQLPADAPPEPEPAPPVPIPLPEPEPEPEPVAAPTPLPEPEPEPARPPALAESDDFVREQARAVADDDGLEAVLDADQLVRRYTAVLESAARGELVREPIAYLSLPGAFAVEQRGDRLFMAPSNYARYDGAAALVEAIDPARAKDAVAVLQPLFAAAYEELGEPPMDVADRIVQAIDKVLATPEVDGPVELERITVMYTFKDPRLEALAPTQKLLLRMGPVNGARVRTALRALRAALAP